MNQTTSKTIINNEQSKSYLLYKDLETRVIY
jgi:hypothetical protein